MRSNDAAHCGVLAQYWACLFQWARKLDIDHQYRKYDENMTPLAKLFVTMLDKMGTNASSFKDSHDGLNDILRG